MTLTYSSPKCRDILGVDPRDTLGKTFADLASAAEQEGLRKHLERTWSAGRSFVQLECTLESRSGEPVEVELSGAPVLDADGGWVGFRGVARDVTVRSRARREKAALEEQLRHSQRLEAIGRLAGGISHDFNNILTALMGNSGCLRSRLSAPDRDESELLSLIDEVEGDARRAAALTHQLLAFSRRQVLQPKVVAVNDCLSELTVMLSRLIREDVELRFDLDPDAGCVLADSSQLQQVFVNLAVNASDALSDGGVITITTRAEEAGSPAGERVVVIRVHDTGAGIDAETLPHVFEPFFTTKPQGKGIGLGLASAHGIVNQSGGTMDVKSEGGRGTTFEVRLPRVEAEPTEEESPAPRESGRPNASVLICEDYDGVRTTMERALVRAGFEVRVASHPEQALELAAASSGFDVLVTDLVMPGMDGRDVARRVREMHPHTKVLYVTGYGHDVVQQYGLDEDLHLLEKPFTGTALVRAVDELVL